MRARRPIVRTDDAILDDDAAAPVETAQRWERRGADLPNQRFSGQTRFERAKEARARLRVVVVGPLQSDPKRETLADVDAGVLREHRVEAAQHQPRADE